MADAFKSGMNHLIAAVKGNRGTAITYKRGGESVSITATVGGTEAESDETAGIYVRYRSRDYLIEAADLIISGSQTEPARGDTIEETINGETHTFEVLPLGGEQAFAYSDHNHKQLRVHTRNTQIG